MMKNNPKISLYCRYAICAAHKLYNPDWSEEKNKSIYGKCVDLHGHQYSLEITLEGMLPQDTGMLINGFEVDKIVGEKIIQKIDHKFINEDIPFFKNHPATAEWIAVWVYEEIEKSFPPHCQLKRVRVYETPELFAEYSE